MPHGHFDQKTLVIYSIQTFAPYIYAGFMGLVVLFQFALALGAPWGSLAMAGKFPGKFPPLMRIAAIVQGLVLCLLAVIVLIRADVVLPGLYSASEIAIWVVVAISVLSLVMNLATPSKWERIIWVPVCAIHVITALLVALS